MAVPQGPEEPQQDQEKDAITVLGSVALHLAIAYKATGYDDALFRLTPDRRVSAANLAELNTPNGAKWDAILAPGRPVDPQAATGAAGRNSGEWRRRYGRPRRLDRDRERIPPHHCRRPCCRLIISRSDTLSPLKPSNRRFPPEFAPSCKMQGPRMPQDRVGRFTLTFGTCLFGLLGGSGRWRPTCSIWQVVWLRCPNWTGEDRRRRPTGNGCQFIDLALLGMAPASSTRASIMSGLLACGPTRLNEARSRGLAGID